MNNAVKQQAEKVASASPINESENLEFIVKPEIDEVPVVLKETIADNLSSVADRVHTKSDVAQDYLNTKADQLHDYAQNTIGKVNQLGHTTASALESSSTYVKDFDLAETGKQIRAGIARRPEISFVVAGVFGLLLGLAIGRKLRSQ